MVKTTRRDPSAARSTRSLGGKVAVLATATALAISLASCATDTSSSGAASDQTLSYGLSAEPTDIKTGVDQGSAAKEVVALVRRGLLQYDSDGQPAPALASEFEVSEDGLNYTFTLRPELKFSNGDSLTSADVKRTFEYFAEPENGATYQSQFAGVTKIDTPDDSTVIVTLDTPQTAFPQVLADPLSAIVPEDPLDSEGSPVGAGPFMITEYSKGVSFTLEPNPDFYNADKVELDSIEMTFMPDAQTRVKALTSGQVQFIDYVPASDYQSLEQTDGVTLDHVPGLYGALLLNLTEGPLAEPKVRQAIAYAVDRESLNEVGTLGYGVPGGGLPIPEDNDYFDEKQAKHFSHDPKKAKDLLAEAGYGDGFSLDLVTTSQYFGYTERAQVVKSDLAEVGIDVKLVTGDYANLISKGDSGDYDLLLSGPPAAMSDPTALTGAFIGGPSFVRSYGINEDLYASLLMEGAQTPNGEEREKIYHELGEIFLENVPFVTTGQGTTAFAYSDSLEGFTTIGGALVYSSLYSFETVRLTD
ncbi:ABC transporter substrate-binding protein [Paramicrobacterium chengjingii]|uniref:ABC transporter substrate-binding protein n=1 Tax=Paramicrobacterium chengjingii TaxID=2769067 RepID=UPI00141E19D6|nr:ABC transporter substrate-binding protein [Microbacterium chengjingii]